MKQYKKLVLVVVKLQIYKTVSTPITDCTRPEPWEMDCDNATASLDECEASNISLMFPAVIDYLQGIITAIIIIGSLCINSLVIYLVIKFKKLHQRAFYLALQLIVVNLVYTLSVLPATVVGSIARQWILGDIMCPIIGTMGAVFYTFQFFMVLVLTLDRFFTIFTPFFYERNGNKMAIGMSLVASLLGLCRAVSVIVLECRRYSPILKVCSSGGSTSPACKYNNIVTSTFVLICMILSMVLYVAMYLRGRQLDRKVMTVEENNKRKSNKRVLKTFFIISVVIGGVGITSIVLYMSYVIIGKMTLGFYIIQTLIGRTLASSITIADPIIILRNKDVRDAWNERTAN